MASNNSPSINPQPRNLYQYICDVIMSKMVPRGLPYDESTEPKLAVKQIQTHMPLHTFTK